MREKMNPIRIHVSYIYLHLPYKSTIHVGKYISPMDDMGMFGSSRHLVSPWIGRAKLGGEWNGKSPRLHLGWSSKQLTFS